MTGVAAGRREQELRDLAERALSAGTGQTQVTVVAERSLTQRFARSRATSACAVEQVSVEFLCVVDGYAGTASTSAWDMPALRDAGTRARAAAETCAALGGGSGGYPGLAAPAPLRPHHGFDAATAALEPDRVHSALTGAFAAAAEHRVEAFGRWSAGEVRTVIASTTGIRVADAVTDAHMRVTCCDAQGRSGFAAHHAVASGDLDGRRLAGLAAGRVDARESYHLPAGEYPVILESETVGSLLELLGQLAFNGLAHAEGAGALAGRLGTRVAATAVNLSDSPRYIATLPRAFDAEGVPKAPLPLIQDGVAHAVVHDIRSAARAGGAARSTGHALLAGGAPTGPRPTNLVLVGGGAEDEHELAAPIERGLYVTRLWHLNAIHQRETLLTGTTRDGAYLIEDGRITRPLADLRFSDSALRILTATEALTAGSRLVSQADHRGRRFAYGSVCPALRAQGLRVTGPTR